MTERRALAVTTCPTGKLAFRSYADARHELKRIRRDKRRANPTHKRIKAAYACRLCGCYHLTSRAARQ